MTAREQIKEWLDTIARYNADTDAASRFGLELDCQLLDGYGRMAESYTAKVEAVIGDVDDTLKWYWFDNNLGLRGLKASGGWIRRAKAIRTLDDLCDLLGID